MPLLDPYVPRFARYWLAEGSWAPTRPRLDHQEGVVLAADLVGFTSLTDRFARERGKGGAEAVQEILNECFGTLVNVIGEFGGEVLAFAGDATLAVWLVTEEEAGDVVARAGACALAIQRALRDVDAVHDHTVSLRVAISLGPVWATAVGGAANRWHAFMGGPAFQEVADAEDAAQPGEVVLSAKARLAASSRIRCEELADGRGRLTDASQKDGLPGGGVPSPGSDPGARYEDTLRTLVPRGVVAQLESGQGDWLGEFRRATVLFVGLSHVDADGVALLDRLQKAVLTLQEEVYALGGLINQVIVMDNGELTALVVWGLPRCSYENDAERAIRAARSLRAHYCDEAFQPSIGIAAGHVFAGLRGGGARVEYAVIGDPVNLAARLMRKSGGGILCDASVQRAAAGASFAPVRMLELKGKAAPVAAFESTGFEARIDTTQAPLVGRHEELAMFADALRETKDAGGNQNLVLEGEAGIGKSRLTEAVVEEAHAQAYRSLAGHADALRAMSAYHAWKPIFRSLLELDAYTNDEARANHVLRLLHDLPDGRDHASLLDPVLGLTLPESPAAASLSGDGRGHATRELLTRLFKAQVGGAPTLLVLEDVHWLDSASWALAEELSNEVRNLCLLLVARPLGEVDLPEAAERLLTKTTQRVRLAALTSLDAIELARQKLGVTELPRAVADLVLEKAEGHPFFTQELVLALRDTGALRVEDGTCILPPGGLEDARLVPDTVQGVVAARIDRLEAEQQLTLKVASVLGRTISVEALADIHPIHGHRDRILDHLDSMASLDLVTTLEADDRYAFRHAITRDTAYGLLPFSQRKTLHRTAAEWHESRHEQDPAYLSLLADHWSLAGVVPKAMSALESAGGHALNTAAYIECVGFLRRLIEFADGTQETPAAGGLESPEDGALSTEERRGRWLRQLGQAEWNLGRTGDARISLEAAHDLLGSPGPRSGFAAGRALARMAAWRGARRVSRPLRRTVPRPAEQRVRELVRVLNFLGRVYHVSSEPALTMYTILRRQNLLEDRHPSPEHMMALSGWSYLLSMFRMERGRTAAVQQLHDIARQVDEPLVYADALFPVTLMRTSQGEWEDCAREAEIAMTIFREHRERRGELDMTLIIAGIALDRDFDRTVEIWEGVRTATQENQNALIEGWAWGGLALAYLRKGDFATSLRMAEAAHRISEETDEEVGGLTALATSALCHLRLGDVDQATAALEQALPRVRAAPRVPSANHYVHGFTATAEVTLELWERALARGDSKAAKQHARDAATACRALDRFAKVFPFAEPVAAQWSGLQAWLRGRRKLAIRTWHRAVEASETRDSPYLRGRCLLELARHLPTDDPARHRTLEEAARVLDGLGARWDADRARLMLAG